MPKGGSKIRQSCKWLNVVAPDDSIAKGIQTDSGLMATDHPDLLSAYRAIERYDGWVETRLLPIVSKWIEENRERVIDGMSPDEMNDFGAAVESAYSLLEKDGYVEERKTHTVPDLKDVNPLWQKITKARIKDEEK